MQQVLAAKALAGRLAAAAASLLLLLLLAAAQRLAQLVGLILGGFPACLLLCGRLQRPLLPHLVLDLQAQQAQQEGSRMLLNSVHLHAWDTSLGCEHA